MSVWIKKSNFNHVGQFCIRSSQWNLKMLWSALYHKPNAQIQWNQISAGSNAKLKAASFFYQSSKYLMPVCFRGNIKFLLVHWPLEMYSNSMCLTLEKKISSWKLMTSPFSSWIHPFPIKSCSIYNSIVFFYQSSKYLMPVCTVDNSWGELNIAAPMSSWPRRRTIFKKSNFNHGACLKDIPMNSGMLVAQIQWNQQAKFQGKY